MWERSDPIHDGIMTRKPNGLKNPPSDRPSRLQTRPMTVFEEIRSAAETDVRYVVLEKALEASRRVSWLLPRSKGPPVWSGKEDTESGWR